MFKLEELRLYTMRYRKNIIIPLNKRNVNFVIVNIVVQLG
jgi:hypothetical protein